MQKLTLSLSIICFIGLVVLSILFYKSQKEIAYVNNSKLLENYKGMIDARKVYESKAGVWKANIDTLMFQVQKSIENHEKQSPSMSAKEKSLSEELIKTKQKQLRDYQLAIQEKAKQEDIDLTGNVIKQANVFIEKYGKRHDYQIILAATNAGNIVYAKEGMDITDQVLDALNKDYSGEVKK